MDVIFNALGSFFSSIGPFFLLLGLLIFVHELGHYLVAVYFGVRVETFSLGFGKKLLKYKKGDTTYCLSLIPLGGYVKMYGDDPSQDIPESEKRFSFLHQPVWPRIAIVLAGPLMNLFFAALVFAAVGMLGEQVPGTKVGDIHERTAAYAAGFRSGDVIESVNGAEVKKWKSVQEIVEDNAGNAVRFSVRRETGETAEVTATPVLGKNDFIFTTRRQVGKIEGLTTESRAPIISVADPNSTAAQSGLQSLDYVYKINDKEVSYYREIGPLFAEALKAGPVKLEVAKVEPGKDGNDRRQVEIPNHPGLIAAADPLEEFGVRVADLTLFSVKPDSPAEAAGLRPGDVILAIGAVEIKEWDQILEIMKGYNPENGPIEVRFARASEIKSVTLTPEEFDLPTEQGALEKRYAIGVSPAIMTAANEPYLQKADGIGGALVYGAQQSVEWSKLIGISFVRLIQNEVSARNIGGVITIGRVASKSYEAGIVAFLKMMAIISINLFLLNLLPVPVLDGGHLVFFTIEAVKGSPLSLRKMEMAQQVGLVLLLSLMIFALFNDITHLLSAW